MSSVQASFGYKKSTLSKMYRYFFPKEELSTNIFVGEYTYGQPLIMDWTKKYNLKIGKFCSIGGDVEIMLDGNHYSNWVSTFAFQMIDGIPLKEGDQFGKGDMNIGNDVWIGRNVTILPGVSIGNGAVIGAGSIVTKSVEAYSITAGNPAHHIRFRFTPEQIEKLEKIKWWDWDINKIKERVELLRSENIDLFLEKFGNL